MSKRGDRRRTTLEMTDDSRVDTKGLIFGNRFSFKTVLAGISMLAFLLRFLNVIQTFEVPTVVELLGDAKGYFDWAQEISEGNWYGTETFYQAPLYPYFLAVIIKVFGPSITVIRIIQAALGACGVALLGLSVRKLLSAKIGLIAALILATYPPAIFYDGIIQKASLATFLLCILVAACVQLQSHPRTITAFLVGVSLGLLVLTRENALLWIPVVPIWIYVTTRDLASGSWKLLLGYPAGILAILFPIAARNASLGGEWSPTTFQAGTNFYIGNNQNANGIYIPLVPGQGTPAFERYDAKELAEQEIGRPLTSREISKFWMSKALDEIAEKPVRWLQLMIAKTFMTFNRYEVPDVENLYIFGEYSVPLKLTFLMHFGVLCPLGIWGLITTWPKRREIWLLQVFLLTMIAAVTLFFILGRYRNPVAILLIPFAAAGLLDILDRIRTRNWRGIKYSFISTMLVAAIFCNLRVHEEESLQASCYSNMGIAACKVGNLQSGIQFLEQAVAEFPEMAEGYANLGRAYFLDRQYGRAADALRLALRLEPRLRGAYIQLGETYEILGKNLEARQQYQEALRLDPTDTVVQEALMRVQ